MSARSLSGLANKKSWTSSIPLRMIILVASYSWARSSGTMIRELLVARVSI